MTRLKGLLILSHIANAKRGNNEEGEVSDEDDLIKDTENNFNLVKQTGEPLVVIWPR